MYTVKFNFMLIGHSFVSGLEQHYQNKFCSSHPSSLEGFVTQDLMVNDHISNVYFHGQSGATVDNFSIPTLFTSYARFK